MFDKTNIEEQVAERHLAQDRLSGRTMYEGHVLVDLSRLVDECRALRADLRAAAADRVSSVRSIRQKVEQAHDEQDADAHFARMVLVGQLQILDAVLANLR